MRENNGNGGGRAETPLQLLSRIFFFLFIFLLVPLPLVAADDAVLPNENLVADGLPAIPRALAERALGYSDSRSATFEAWHPVRREMLIGTRFADVAEIHRVKFPGGARAQLTFYPERTGLSLIHI